MWSRARDAVAGALRDFSSSWRALAVADLAYKAVAFAVLTPATALLLRWLLSRTGSKFVADADIARFFISTRSGVIALVLGAALFTAITMLEIACLMAIGAAKLNARGALAFAAKHAGRIIRLAFHMVVRAIGAIVPFVIAIAVVYAALVREHDINYYLARKPPEFVIAAALVAIIGAGLLWLVVRTVVRWAFSLPLLLFEDVSPASALGESAKRSEGKRGTIAIALAGWAIVAVALSAAAAALIDAIARGASRYFAGSLAALMPFLITLVILWVVAGLAVTVFNVSMFSLLIVRLWRTDVATGFSPSADGLKPVATLTPAIRAVLVGSVVLFAAGFAMLALMITRRTENVLVIAHRGASSDAPENTLAAFRKAVEQHADYVELDVQESLDGEVMVIHDSDLMKVGGSPMKIWEHTAAELRTVDIGKGEHVPTLAEALAVVKGTQSRMLVELKQYGHDQQLEERVAQNVEAAGMGDRCAFMSLDHNMVAKMKQIRPSWRVGALVAKALGDPTTLGADFLAVEARMLTPRFVRRAHRAGQDVYVWTVNDPAWMLAAASRGSDGVITNFPGTARDVLQQRLQMSDGQRLLVALLIRAGERADALEQENALRP